MSDDEYTTFVEESAAYLCGFSCGTAVDVIVEYARRPDLSLRQLKRLITELDALYEKCKK